MTALRPIEPIDIRGLTPRAPSSGMPIVEYVDPRTLFVDPVYQRGISDRSMRMLRKIVEGFDWTKLKPPICAFAEDGDGNMTLRVIDGQHTAIAAASNPHVEKIPIMIVDAPDTRAQAEAFIGQNADRLGMTATQLHVAAVAAGDEEAQEIENVCREASVTILKNSPSGNVYKSGQTVAVAAIKALLKKEGFEHTRNTLTILSSAGLAPIKAAHVQAVDRLLTEAEFGAIDPDALAPSILGYPQAMKDAGAFAATHGLPLWKALASVWFQKAKKRRGGAGPTTAPVSPGGASARGRGEAVPEDLGRHVRPARGDWQPGNQIGRCQSCDSRFRGGPTAKECADCAYGKEGA